MRLSEQDQRHRLYLYSRLRESSIEDSIQSYPKRVDNSRDQKFVKVLR